MKKTLLLCLVFVSLLTVWGVRPAVQFAQAPATYTDADLMEVGRRENLLPSIITSRLTPDEVRFLVDFHRSVLAANLNGGEWDPIAHIAELNRYAFLTERLHRTTPRFNPALVRRVYEFRGLTLMHLSNAEVARLEGLEAPELVRVVTGRR